MKTCLKCGQNLPEKDFSRDISRPDGLQVYCKACRKRHWRTTRGTGRSALESCTDCELVEELKRRGYPYVPPGHPAHDRLFALLASEYPELCNPNQISNHEQV